MTTLIFDHTHTHSKISEITNLSWISTSMQKITSFHPIILEVQSILKSHDQTGHTDFWPCPPKKILSTFNLPEFVPTCKKSGYFTDLFWRYTILDKTFRDFSFLTQFLFTTSETELHYYHQKVNVRVASRVFERLNTQDPRKWRNFKKISDMHLMASTQPSTQEPNFDVFGKKIAKKSAVNLQPFVKIIWGNRFSFLTRSRPLDFTFSEDFKIWKVPFALQIDI